MAMTLARAWRRQLFGASGAALLVPGTLAVALVLLGFAGGFGRLGALGQAFAGPSIPTAAGIPGRGHHRAPTPPLVPAAPATAPAAAAPATASTGTGAAPSGVIHTGPTGAPGTVPSGGGGRSHGGGGSGSHHGGNPRTPTPTPAPAPTPTPAPPPSGPTGLIDGVVDLGTSVTNKVPGPVGTTATQLLQSLGKTVDGLLPLAQSSDASAQSTDATDAGTQ
jgi:hypothetical protein